MTQYMHVYGFKKRATSKMNRSTHTLSILKEYGKSKPTVWLEAAWSMARVCLEHVLPSTRFLRPCGGKRAELERRLVPNEVTARR